MGFKVIIFPFAALAPAYAAVKGGMETLKRDGRMGSQECLTPQMLFRVCGLDGRMGSQECLTPQMLFRVCGLDGSVKVDVEAGWGWEF